MTNRYTAQRQQVIEALPHEVFRVFSGLGGQRGWLAFDWVWQLRAGIDGLIGGIGMRRGRPRPAQMTVGDAVDFWRVEALESNRLLRLYAEMILPGEGWLQFEVEDLQDGRCRLIQTASFIPTSFFGHCYWLALAPVHFVLYSTLIFRIAEIAERNHRTVSSSFDRSLTAH